MLASKNRLRIPVIMCLIAFMGFFQDISAQSQLRILPLGNSITRGSMCLNGNIYDCTEGLKDSDAIGYRDRLDIYDCTNGLLDSEAIGYRNSLYNLLDNSGYNIDFVGGNKYGYSIMSDSDNAGFSGIKDQELADIIESGSTSSKWGQVTPGPYLDYYPADIVLLHIGTNDVLADEYTDVSNVTRLLNAIDDYETENGKPVLVFLAKIINPQSVSCGNDYKTTQYNNRLVSMAQSRISAGDKLVVVDMNCGAGINYYTDMTDQAHPNQTGYDKMADKWFEVIDGYNTAPVVSQIPNQSIAQGASFAQISLDNYVSDAEDSPADMIWSFHPSSPTYLNVSIEENRIATISAKDSEWSGYEEIEFVAMDRGKVVTGLQKTDNCVTRFSIAWAPEIIGQEDITIDQEQALEITLDHVILADAENAPSGLSILVSAGSNYTVNGTTITPADNFYGQISVPVVVVDDGTESNTWPLVVNVSQVNNPPVITSSPITIAYTNGLYQYLVTASDADPGDELSYSASQKPTWLNIDAGSGLLYGTPLSGQEGLYDITVKVSDGYSEDEQNFTLTVIFRNQAPLIVSEPSLVINSGQTYTYGIMATDNDQDPLKYFASILPDWLEFMPVAQVLIGTPSNSDSGSNMVSLGVTDQTDTTYQSFMIDVSPVAGNPESGIDLNTRVYPNPVNDRMVIDLEELYSFGDIVVFELFDMTGRRVIQMELYDQLTEVSLSDYGLSEVIYLYQLSVQSTRNKVVSGKLLKSSSGLY